MNVVGSPEYRVAVAGVIASGPGAAGGPETPPLPHEAIAKKATAASTRRAKRWTMPECWRITESPCQTTLDEWSSNAVVLESYAINPPTRPSKLPPRRPGDYIAVQRRLRYDGPVSPESAGPPMSAVMGTAMVKSRAGCP